MTCDAARELLLEADLRALTGELRAHIDECAECRALAEQLRDAERRLARDIAASVSPTDPATAVRRAGVEARRRARRRRGAGIVTLAAAAGLAAILVVPGRRGPRGIVPIAETRAPLTVTAPPGRNVAVLRTDNPDVVVFWFF
jgi:predicted anti-sigma-YlaC factor YlaD